MLFSFDPKEYKKDVLVAALKNREQFDVSIKKGDYKNKDTIIKKLLSIGFDFNLLPSKSNQKSIKESLKETSRVLKKATPKIKRFGEAVENIGAVKYQNKLQKIAEKKRIADMKKAAAEQLKADKKRAREEAKMVREVQRNLAYKKQAQKQREREQKKLTATQSVGPRFVGPLLPTQTRREAKPRAPRTLNAI